MQLVLTDDFDKRMMEETGRLWVKTSEEGSGEGVNTDRQN